MFQDGNTHLLRLLVEERHESLRRAAGASRLRRDARRTRPPRGRSRRDGPSR